jgi:hypothetical protein
MVATPKLPETPAPGERRCARRFAFRPQLVVKADDVVERPGLAGARSQLRAGEPKFGERITHFAREDADLAVQLLFDGRQPGLRAIEPLQRLIDRGEARLGDARRLHVDLAHRLFVRLPDGLPLVLEAALELVDARGRLVEQPALDVVPLAQPPMQFRHGGRVLLVAVRPALEDRRALARHVRRGAFRDPGRESWV